MLTRRIILCVSSVLFAPALLHAQAVNLTEAPLEGRCVKNEITMQLDGKITIKQDGKDLSFPHKPGEARIHGTFPRRAGRRRRQGRTLLYHGRRNDHLQQ